MDVRPDMTATSYRDSATGHPARSDLGPILTSLSREICRPLTSLRMGFDLLLSDTARPILGDQRGHVETMVTLCDDLLRLTRSYLDYAGLVHGGRPLEFGAFTVGALVKHIDRTFSPEAASRRIDWSCGLEGADATVTTDAARCQQIFAHLVANALRYTPEGGGVRVEGRLLDDRRWAVGVTDSGPGIPAEHREQVFEPFYRLPRDDHHRAEGNGLGLAVCRALVDQLGGEISLDSGTGQGTRVTVVFPVDAAEALNARSGRR